MKRTKRPKIEPYYVATKDGQICYQSEERKAVVAWKLAFGASIWKVTPHIRKIKVRKEDEK